MTPVDAVLLSGAVGAGKTTTAHALAALLERRGDPMALIDLDELRHVAPAPPHDPFHLALTLANLEAVVSNDRAAGARRFVLAGVVESADERDRIARATAAERLLLCRLVARQSVVDERIRRRAALRRGRLEWELARARELALLQAAADADDLVLDTSALAPDEAALAVARAAGWAADQDPAPAP